MSGDPLAALRSVKSQLAEPCAVAEKEAVIMAEIGAPHGVKGWVRLRSYAQTAESIARYAEFDATDGERSVRLKVQQYGTSGQHLIASIQGVQTRDEAESLQGLRLSMPAAQLAPLPEGEYYWHQIIGMKVYQVGGDCLGRVASFIETGGNDVLVVEQGESQILIPWGAPVREVDMQQGTVQVDWDLEY